MSRKMRINKMHDASDSMLTPRIKFLHSHTWMALQIVIGTGSQQVSLLQLSLL